jgi:aspartate racemase
MKTIGLIGGMSWESTAHYYAHINRLTQQRRGGVHSAPILLYSFDFSELEALQRKGDWATIALRIGGAAVKLEAAGAGLILVCANTMHIVAGEIAAGLGVPLIHIVDPAAQAIRAAGLRKVGLLGTAYTMEHSFFPDRLRNFGIEALVPEKDDRALCHRIIFEELVRGIVREDSRAAYRRVIGRLVERGAQGIILGCTELTMIVGEGDCPVPAFDTAELHARAAVSFALDEPAA